MWHPEKAIVEENNANPNIAGLGAFNGYMTAYQSTATTADNAMTEKAESKEVEVVLPEEEGVVATGTGEKGAKGIAKGSEMLNGVEGDEGDDSGEDGADGEDVGAATGLVTFVPEISIPVGIVSTLLGASPLPITTFKKLA